MTADTISPAKELVWKRDGFYSQSWPTRFTCRYFVNSLPVSAIPAVLQCCATFAASGFQATFEQVRILRTDTYTEDPETPSIDYRVCDTLSFLLGTARINVEIRGGGSSVEAAIQAASTTIHSISYAAEPVRPGRGQQARIKERARELLQKHGPMLPQECVIYVAYCTRAGRGGYKEKIADRRFQRSELNE